MPGIPTASGKDVLNALLAAGWEEKRVNGSHHILFKEGTGPPFSINVNGNKDLKPGTMKSIIRSAGLTLDEFIGLLKR